MGMLAANGSSHQGVYFLPWSLHAMQIAATSLGKDAAGCVPWEADSEKKFVCRMLSKEDPGCLGSGRRGKQAWAEGESK